MTDDLIERLLPCPNPWCTARNMPLPVFLKREGWRVLCECGVSTYRYPTEADARTTWNTRIATQQEAIDELVGLIRECRLADAYAARTGDETRWDRAFHALCRAEKGER